MSKHTNFAIVGLCRRHLWWIAIWAATALGLWRFSSQPPRFTFKDNDVGPIIAMTPDSRTMVALTLRTEHQSPRHSGPVLVWDLTTGRRRTFELASQNSLGQAGYPLGASEELVDAGDYDLSVPAEPITGRVCHLIQTNRRGERWGVEIDLDQGTTKQTRLPDLQPAEGSTLPQQSPRGRWIVDVPASDGELHEAGCVLRIIDATTGTVTKEFTGFYSPRFYFSDDETRVAVVEHISKKESRTTILQLEPLETLRVFDVGLANIKFSPSNHWIACTDHHEVLLIEIQSGEVLHRFPKNEFASGAHRGFPRNFRFSPDEQFLIGYDYLSVNRIGVWVNTRQYCKISGVWIWDLASGQLSVRRGPSMQHFFDPNPCNDESNDHTTPQLLIDDKRLIDSQSGQTILAIPDNSNIERANPEHGIVILERRSARSTNRVLNTLYNWNVWIPDVLWQVTNGSQLLVCDTGSRRVRRILPRDDYVVDRSSLMLTPDGKSLITKSNSSSDGSSIIHVWDISSAQSWTEVVGWSFLAPIGCLLWNFLRRSRAGRSLATTR